MKILLLEHSDDICRDNQNLRIHPRGHLRIKGDLTDHTGGRKHAQLTRIQTEQCDFSPFLGEKIGADLAGKDEQHSETFVVAAAYERALFIMTDKGTSAQRFLLLFGQGWPERKLCQCAFHINGSYDCRSRGHRRCDQPRRAHGHGGHSEHCGRSPDFH